MATTRAVPSSEGGSGDPEIPARHSSDNSCRRRETGVQAARMGDLGIHVWAGQSGQKYRYTVYMYGTAFGPGPANYIFARETRAGQYQVLYVGQAQDLSEPFDDHRCAGMPETGPGDAHPRAPLRSARRAAPRGALRPDLGAQPALQCDALSAKAPSNRAAA